MEQKRKAAANMFFEQQAIEEESNKEMVQDDIAPAPTSEVAMEQAASGLAMPAAAPQQKAARPRRNLNLNQLKTSEELQMEKPPISVRITGFGPWQRVIVPPNAYVVHMRIGREKPVTIGLGLSFKYDPQKDSFLIVPAAMQTIGVVANCISKEKQGINILAYVQWQIDDFSIAYKKLDFSDQSDPLGIVNAQLREQAEAAIKDKIATMSVEEVLTDKEPVIEELTSRLKQVTEGRQGKAGSDDGLGIKIVTVQIREAIVSSEKLWTDLQQPFRYEKEKASRISYLSMQNELNQKELESRRLAEAEQTETTFKIEEVKQKKQTETQELKLKEEGLRFSREQDNLRKKIAMEEETQLARKQSEERLKSKEHALQIESELDMLRQEDKKVAEQLNLAWDGEKRQLNLDTDKKIFTTELDAKFEEFQSGVKTKMLEIQTTMQKLEVDLQLLIQANKDRLSTQTQVSRLEREAKEHQAQITKEKEKNALQLERQKHELELEELHQKVRNSINDHDILSQFIARLPEIASHMPEIKDLHVLQTSANGDSFDGLATFLTKLFSTAKLLGITLPGQKEEAGK